ncbi:MAG TPA: UbiA family prenyltransferase [Cyclobacteriaceae bacterium]|nr:UbiA family prenyltransferase [Cyclobacteriaceae bacterium]
MFSRSSWLHLRIPFSYFLLPVFLFSLALSPNLDPARIFWVFFIVHFLLYPASNGYNSYFDKDEESIGGLRNPPKVDHGLYVLSLLLDALAIVLGYMLVNKLFALMLFVYGLVSKAYSHPRVRLKRYPVTGWLVAGFFQGIFTFLMCYIGTNDFPLSAAFNARVIFAGLLTSLMLLGNYPMTQVYQHREDARRGDLTISRMLGIHGTFKLTGIVFLLVFICFAWYFIFFFELLYSALFVIAILPVAIYFIHWVFQVRRDARAADYDHTMRLNLVSATCLNVFFLFLLVDSHNLAQLL